MHRWLMVLCFMAWPTLGLAAEDNGHGRHRMNRGQASPQRYEAAGDPAPLGTGSEVPPIHDNEIFGLFRADRLEYQSGEGQDLGVWDVQAWAGTDYHRLYLESEGAWLLDAEELEEASLELLYGVNIGIFWDLRLGLRHDIEPAPSRTFASVGVQGLAPLWFEVDAAAFVSEDGDLSAQVEAEYDLFLSQRLVVQPRLEIGLALQEVEANGVGQGLNTIELGVRLRYEIHRKLAPYVGIAWSRKVGETADLAEAEGEEVEVTSFVAGVTFWF